MYFLYILCSCCLETLVWPALYLIVFKKECRFSPGKNIILIVFLCLAVSLAAYVCLVYTPLNISFYMSHRIWYSIIFAFFMVCLCLWLSRAKVSIALFTSLIIKNYLDTASLSAQLLERFVTVPLLLLEWLHILLIVPIIYLFLIRPLKQVISTTSTMFFWKYLWLIPLSFYFIFRFGIVPGYTDNLEGLSSASSILPYIWFFITFIVYYLILHILREARKQASLSEQIYFSQIDGTIHSQEYHHLQEELKQAVKARKNISNTLQQLEDMAQQGQLEKLSAFIEKELENLTRKDNLVLCQNYAVNMILRHYINQAKELNIKFNWRLQIGPSLPISEVDTSIILGNLLENALHACKHQTANKPFLELRIQINECKFLLSLQNSYEGTILRKDNLFMSTKHEGPGLGITSVKTIVEKYDGVFQVQYSADIFTVNVLIESI